MATTVAEVARRTNVSRGLVYRLVHNDPTLRVTEETVERIRKVERELGGIKINRSARSLVMPVSRVFAERWHGRYSSHLMFRNIEMVARERDFRLNINYFDPPNQLAFFEDMAGSPDFCSGIIILGGIIDEPLACFLLENHFPHVVIDPEGERFGVNTVMADAIIGVRQAIDHLWELGHRRIGFLGSAKVSRLPVFMFAMTERGLPVDAGSNCILLSPPMSQERNAELSAAVRRDFSGYLNRQQPPATAFICQNDAVAHSAVDVLREHGLRPGRDIALVGYDNIEERGEFPSARPMLTTIDNPMDLVGRRAADSLINQILHKQHQIVHEHIPTKLIIRETTGSCVGGRQQQKG